MVAEGILVERLANEKTVGLVDKNKKTKFNTVFVKSFRIEDL